MLGIHQETCTYCIYTDDDIRTLRQPQRRMNPILKEIVKEELQKLLKAGAIYRIFDSQWVSPLLVVLKKNGKWIIYVDYGELNKATHKDYFPLPFIDQVLDALAEKKIFFILRWIKWIQSNRNCIRRPRQNYFHMPLGYICL